MGPIRALTCGLITAGLVVACGETPDSEVAETGGVSSEGGSEPSGTASSASGSAQTGSEESGSEESSSESGSPWTEEEEGLAEEFAETFCGLKFSVTCEDYTPYMSEAGCIELVSAVLLEQQEAAHDAGLVFDGACTPRLLGWYEGQAQKHELDSLGLVAAVGCCSTYHGAVGLGEACTEYGTHGGGRQQSDCQTGSFCDDGVCVEGFPCRGEYDLDLGAPCWSDGAAVGNCRADLFCDSTSGACVGRDSLGEACRYTAPGQLPPGHSCEAGGYCGIETDTCLPLENLGEACGQVDACDLGECADGTCIPEDPASCSIGVWQLP